MLGTALVRAAGLVLGYLLTVVLSRVLGTSGFGEFSSGLAVAAILATIAGLGLPTLATRDLARIEAGAERAEFIKSALLGVGAAALTVLAVCISWAVWTDATSASILMIALAVFPPTTLVRLRQGIAVPIVGATEALLPEQIILPLVAMAGIGLLAQLRIVGPVEAGTAYAAASFIALAAGVASLGRASGLFVSTTHVATPNQRASVIARRGVPFLLAELPGTLAVNADVVLVSTILGMSAGGVYAVSTRLAGLIMIPVTIVNLTYMPRFAESGSATSNTGLSAHACEASFFSFAGGALVACVLFLAYPGIIATFGPGFGEVFEVLAALGAVRVLTAATAPNESVLLMTGHESLAVLVSWIRAALLVVFCSAGAAMGSVASAGFGTATAMLLAHMLLVVITWRYGGVLAYPRVKWSRLRSVLMRG